MERQTDIQTPYSFNGQLSSDLNRRQIPCIAASQRPTGLLLLCSLPQNACADSPLMARALYFLWLLHEENGCNCSKEIVAMHSKMWIFYDITCFVIHKSSSCWKSWAFSNFQWKNQHIDIQQDAMMVIFICFEIQVLTLATALIYEWSKATQEQDEKYWCVSQNGTHSSQCCLVILPGIHQPEQRDAFISFLYTSFETASEKTQLYYWSEFMTHCGLLFSGAYQWYVLLEWETQIHLREQHP